MAAKSNDKLRAAHAHVAARSPTIYSIPAASREWARKKFQHFSLSRYSDETRPANYVAPKHAKNVAVIQKANKAVMGRNIAHWPKEIQGDAGLRLSLANKDLRALLPSYKPATGTIKIEELIAALKTHMTGPHPPALRFVHPTAPVPCRRVKPRIG